MVCARHPKTETGLTCARCGTPICPECLVQGAVGMLCPDCGKTRSPVADVSPARFVLALAAGLAAGTIVGLLLQAIGFFLFVVAPILGGLLGDVVLRLTGRKSGPKVEFLVGASVFGGALAAVVLTGGWMRLIAQPIQLALFAVALAMTAGAAFAKVRYW